MVGNMPSFMKRAFPNSMPHMQSHDTTLPTTSFSTSFYHSHSINNYFNGNNNNNHSNTSSKAENDDSVLIQFVQAYDWANVLARIASHPSETRRLTGYEGRTALHLACEHDAPAVVIQSLLKACPDASTMVGHAGMTPLHITCTSYYASIHVIRVLLDAGRPEQCQIRDLDGDTPLHTACRCGAPLEVLECLLQAYPDAVHVRDKEGLTPLLRLWVRYNVILGARVIEEVQSAADLRGELGDAWHKTELLLRYAYYTACLSSTSVSALSTAPSSSLSLSNIPVVHAASSVDCPRVVVRIASVLYPHQLEEKDDRGWTPLTLAAHAPVFKVRDLSDEGCTVLEDVVYGNENYEELSSFALAIATDNETSTEESLEEGYHGSEFSSCSGGSSSRQGSSSSSSNMSVIDVILQASLEHGYFSALWPDKQGQLPLHVALVARKKWDDGVKSLVEAYPEALTITHPPTSLYPFMMAAVPSLSATSSSSSESHPTDNDSDSPQLDTIYKLLRHAPCIMGDILTTRAIANKK